MYIYTFYEIECHLKIGLTLLPYLPFVEFTVAPFIKFDRR